MIERHEMFSDSISAEDKSLPSDAANLLKKAAKTPITKHDKLARVKAIDKAIDIIKSKYPKLFR